MSGEKCEGGERRPTARRRPSSPLQKKKRTRVARPSVSSRARRSMARSAGHGAHRTHTHTRVGGRGKRTAACATSFFLWGRRRSLIFNCRSTPSKTCTKKRQGTLHRRASQMMNTLPTPPPHHPLNTKGCTAARAKETGCVFPSSRSLSLSPPSTACLSHLFSLPPAVQARRRQRRRRRWHTRRPWIRRSGSTGEVVLVLVLVLVLVVLVLVAGVAVVGVRRGRDGRPVPTPAPAVQLGWQRRRPARHAAADAAGRGGPHAATGAA